MSRRRSFLRAARHWLTPGLHVKRWLLALVLGTVIMGMGVVFAIVIAFRFGVIPDWLYGAMMLDFIPLTWRVLLLLLVGGLLITLAVVRLGAALVEPFRQPGDSVAASLYHHSRRSRGPYVVAIGGGTGLPSLLRGLKAFTRNVTAVVTVADDGGSSGRLRQELGLLPPGDFRNNIAALSRDEALMTQVLQYRFGGDVQANGRASLRGHAFGNLLLAALAGVTGSFDEGLLAAERVLAISGRVVPSTLEQVALVAEVVLGDDAHQQTQRIVGESAITHAGGRIKQIALDPRKASAYPPAVQAILQADLVVLGPGSLYTSIMPNLLVSGIAAAVRHTLAPVVYVCNIATQPGETDGYSVADHADAISRYAGQNCLDAVVANDNVDLAGTVNDQTIPVPLSWPSDRAGQARLITADLVDEQHPWRHDSKKLAGVIRRILEGDVGNGRR